MGSTNGTLLKDYQFHCKVGNTMGSTNDETLSNEDNQFHWKVGNTLSVLTRTNGANIFSPNFQFEDESWQFILEKVIPVGEPPHVARDSFLLKLTNQTRNPKAEFHVQLSVTYLDRICSRTIKSGLCKLDFRVKTAEYKFIPEDIAVHWPFFSKNLPILQQSRCTDRSQWMFSCQICKSETPYKEETLFSINEGAAFERLENNAEWKLKSVVKLQEDLNSLLHGGKNSDVILKMEGREFKAHRSILSARSDYFSAMFDHDTSERQTGIVNIEDSDPDAFQCLLQYIYTGDTCFSPESISSLYTVADRYQVLELKEECEKQIKSNLSVGNFCDVARMSLRHPELSLREIISQFFAKNASDIVSTPEWETFMQENPKLCNKLFCKTLKAAR